LSSALKELPSRKNPSLNQGSSGKAHDGIRTRDLFLTKEVLYRLSYMGIRAAALPFAKKNRRRLESAADRLERETGLEPATPSLEGSRSTN
jgi:hypothetical protein